MRISLHRGHGLEKTALSYDEDVVDFSKFHIAGAPELNEGPKMSHEFADLSVPEIKSLIERAHEEIARRKEAGRESLRAEISEKLKNAGLELEDLFPKPGKKTGKSRSAEGNEGTQRVVVAKYKNHVTGETWSGRGARPRQWVKSIMMERGWTLDEFKQSKEFLAQN